MAAPLQAVPDAPLILAIAAHRDDVEQTCGGTLLVQAALGYRTAILDLTQGESGTRGSAAEREAEAHDAARILRISHREALDLPDGSIQNTIQSRLKIAAVIRRLRPRVVILPYWQGRHPDHYTSATLGYEACFAAGLSRADIPGPPHRPYKILYASLYADVRPSFVVDITPHIETRLQALLAYRSQYGDQSAGDRALRSLSRRSANASPRPPATTACLPACAMPSPSSRKRSPW